MLRFLFRSSTVKFTRTEDYVKKCKQLSYLVFSYKDFGIPLDMVNLTLLKVIPLLTPLLTHSLIE